MNNLLRTLTESKAKAAFPDTDLKLLLTTVKDGRRQAHDSKLTDPFYDSLEGLLLDLRTTSIDNHDAEAFLKPVSKAEVPDYYDVITNPMDLQTMLKKVKQKQYKSKREFKDDLELIWSNCYTYNATETHPLRLCAKRLKIKSERLLRNITDRKERADPSIPAALGGGGPPPGRTSASPFPSSKPSVNGTAPLANGHRPPKITIKPPTRKAAFSVGKRDVPAQTPFAEMPALIRTADGMNAFAQLARDADIDPTELRPYLPPDLDAQVQLLTPLSVKEEQDDDAEESLWSADSGLGDKRKWNGHDPHPRPRKRLKPGTSGADPNIWWAAVHSDALLANGLPGIAHPSSSSSSSSFLRHTKSPSKPKSKSSKSRSSRKARAAPDDRGLLPLMNGNIRTMRRLRHTHARFAALGLGATTGGDGADEVPGSLGMMPMVIPPPPVDVGLLSMPELDEPELVDGGGEMRVDERAWGWELGLGERKARRRRRRAAAMGEEGEGEIEVGAGNADHCLRWMGGKVLEHAGFQGTSQVALDVLASVTSEYLLNVGRTIRYLCDKYSNTMTPEEIILHTLFESGISRVQDLERYISDDVERYGARLGDLEKKLVGAYREVTAVDTLSDEGLFEDEDDEESGALTMGDFADLVGEDYLGLRELGIAAEFGISNLSIPKKLLRGKKRIAGSGAGNAAPAPPPLPYPLPPPFITLTASKVDSQIGLLRPYYLGRFAALAAASAPSAPYLPLPGPPMSLPGPPTLSLGALPGPPGTLPALPGPPGTLHVPPGSQLPTFAPVTMPPPPPPQPPPPVTISPHLELPDDVPPPPQAKMGPLGQILISKAATKKKVGGGPTGGGGGGGGSPAKVKQEGGAPGEPKKKKKGATGVGTGNGRKKNGVLKVGGDGALMPPPPVPAPIVAAGV